MLLHFVHNNGPALVKKSVLYLFLDLYPMTNTVGLQYIMSSIVVNSKPTAGLQCNSAKFNNFCQSCELKRKCKHYRSGRGTENSVFPHFRKETKTKSFEWTAKVVSNILQPSSMYASNGIHLVFG